MDINKNGIINQDEIEKWRGIQIVFENWDVTQDLIVWLEKHVVDSFEKVAKILFNSMSNEHKLAKADFVNWFTRKTSGLRHSDQMKLANSMRKVFTLFDKDGSNMIDFEEFRYGFWRIEAFFEG